MLIGEIPTYSDLMLVGSRVLIDRPLGLLPVAVPEFRDVTHTDVRTQLNSQPESTSNFGQQDLRLYAPYRSQLLQFFVSWELVFLMLLCSWRTQCVTHFPHVLTPLKLSL